MHVFLGIIVAVIIAAWGYICYMGSEIDKLRNEMQFIRLQIAHMKNHQNIGNN